MQSQHSTQSRCLRTFSDGRGCRMLRKPGHPALCVFHAHEEEQLLETEKLAAELASLSGSLNTGLDINHVLGKVFQALAQRRISAREATTFAYIAQLMLQSMPYVKNEIRWATNDAEAYYRMIRQSIPAVRDLPKSQSTRPPLPTHRPAPTRTTSTSTRVPTRSQPAPRTSFVGTVRSPVWSQ